MLRERFKKHKKGHTSEGGVSLNGVISSLRAFGQGGGQMSRVVCVSARAPFGALGGQ